MSLSSDLELKEAISCAKEPIQLFVTKEPKSLARIQDEQQERQKLLQKKSERLANETASRILEEKKKAEAKRLQDVKLAEEAKRIAEEQIREAKRRAEEKEMEEKR